MSHDQHKQNTGPGSGVSAAWGTVFCWAGIGLLRMLLGAAVWGVFLYLAHQLMERTHPEVKFLGEAPTWYIFIFPLLPIFLIASTAFFPLFRGLESASIRRKASVVEITGKLLVPAILIHAIVAFSGGIGLGITNFFLVVVVCFLATLALDFERQTQFVSLLLAGAQAIVVGVVVLLVLDLDTPPSGWQVKVASWLGALPPTVLMVVLFKQSRQAALSAQFPESLEPGKEESGP